MTSNGEDDAGEVHIRNLDFSQFHDLMHYPFTRYCRSSPGGSKRHVALWLEFVAVERLRALTLCRVGVHRWVRWQVTGGNERFDACRDCIRRRY